MCASQAGKSLNVVMLYVHRYIRLTPSVGAIILFSLFIFPHLASGPYWMGGVDDFDSWYVPVFLCVVCVVIVVCARVVCACVRGSRVRVCVRERVCVFG